MAIVDLQRRARELGRIRIGQLVAGSNGKMRPEKLDRFRLTSASRELLEMVAKLYGGTVNAWTPMGGGPSAFEVVTESTRLPVLVPPQPVSQYYELWSGGGAQRRCDGVTELLSDKPCICGPNPEEKACKPTTRLNVILRDIEGIGVWRLESHGWHSAVELPDVADFLAQSKGYIEAHLALEERVSKKDGKTKRFMVPTLEVSVTPAQLMAGHGAQELAGPAPAQLSGPAPRALEAAPSAPVVVVDKDSVAQTLKTILAGGTLEDLRSVWPEARDAGLKDLWIEIGEKLKADVAVGPVVESAASEDVDALWAEIMRTVPSDWSTTKVEEKFTASTGVSAEAANAADMQAYLISLRSGEEVARASVGARSNESTNSAMKRWERDSGVPES